MLKSELAELQARPVLSPTQHPGNQLTTNLETARYYAQQKAEEGPAVVAVLLVSDRAVVQDPVTPEDYRVVRRCPVIVVRVLDAPQPKPQPNAAEDLEEV